MKKKFFGTKNQYANLPQDVKHTTYPSKGFAVHEGMYVDTQPELDNQHSKAISKLKRGMVK